VGLISLWYGMQE